MSEMHAFRNRLAALANLDMDQLVRAEVIWAGDREDWHRFRRDPYRWFLRADDATAAMLWGLIEARAHLVPQSKSA